MTISPIDLVQFESVSLIDSQVKMSHTVDKGLLPGSDVIWYRKEMESPAKARREWLAQEFLRLIIPNQTETRLASNSISSVFYVLSKEIPGFAPLPEGQKELFANGTYKGLGNIAMGAYFVHEADLKNGNVGKGRDNIVYKIDGDWAFASMRGNQFPEFSAQISVYQLRRLPYPVAYRCHNWLDLVIEGKYFQKSDIIDDSHHKNLQLKKEIFLTMFKLLLLPDFYIEIFVDAFIPAEANSYSDYLISRRKNLLTEALKYPDFLTYMKENSEELTKVAHSFLADMSNFVVNGDHSVIPDKNKINFLSNTQPKINAVLFQLGINSAGTEHDSPSAEAETSGIAKRPSTFFTVITTIKPYSLDEVKLTEEEKKSDDMSASSGESFKRCK
ncbi:MAG: hypothetical protein EBY16_07880 [Gammaproteobacteria bacterium]|nr:hypothetical protein [Gammaproteobacteria bacterium]